MSSRRSAAAPFVRFGNLNFLIDGWRRLLLRGRRRPLPPGPRYGREYRSVRLCRAPLAPKAHVFCSDPAVLGAPFFIMEYRPGLVVRDVLPPVLAGKGIALSGMLIDVMADFQRVDPAAVGLDGLGRPGDFLVRAVAGWIKRFHVAARDFYADGRSRRRGRTERRLEAAAPVPRDGRPCCTNDYN